MYKQICLVVSLIAIICLAACDKQKRVRSPSGDYAPEAEAQPANSAVPATSIELPAECKNGTAITVLQQKDGLSLCQCTDGQSVSFWGSAAKTGVSETPRDLCLAGLFYPWQIRSEPVRHLLSESVAMGTPLPADLPKPAPTATSTAAVTTAPAAQAKSNAKVAAVQEETTSDLQIAYECSAGKAAKRSLTSKGKAAGNEFQTCSGDKIACLKDRSAQRDFTSPPCLCAGGQSPREIMKNMWMCD